MLALQSRLATTPFDFEQRNCGTSATLPLCGNGIGMEMTRQLLIALALLSVGLTGAHGKPAQARNEDVPKGPVAAPPQTAKPTNPQAPTGSVNTGDKKSAPASEGGGGKTAPPPGK